MSALNREPKTAIEEGLPLTLFPPQLFSAPDDDVEDCPPGQPVSKRLLLATTDRNGTTVFLAVDRVAHAFKHTETGHPNNPGVRRLAQPRAGLANLGRTITRGQR